VAWIVLAGAVLLPVAHSLGFAERIHLSNESLMPIGLGLLAFFYLAVVYGQRKIEDQLEQLKTSRGPQDPGWGEQIKRSIPEDLREIFSAEIDRFCQALHRAKTDEEFVIRNAKLTDRFSSAYGRILRRFPNSTFYATAPAKKQYWKVFISNSEGQPSILDEFQHFLDGKGAVMKRIFFVEDPKMLTQEECEVILPQVRLLTATYLASIQSARDMDRLRYFAVEGKNEANPRISWEVRTDGLEVLEVVASLDREKALGFIEIGTE
jgi:hypothetical protein